MSIAALDNLVRVGQLKAEARNAAEAKRLLAMAKTRLTDARLETLSVEGRFSSVYNAAHVAALAALRWHGYRSENRYAVFQCLTHTMGWPAPRGEFWMPHTRSETWLNTRVFLRWMNWLLGSSAISLPF